MNPALRVVVLVGANSFARGAAFAAPAGHIGRWCLASRPTPARSGRSSGRSGSGSPRG